MPPRKRRKLTPIEDSDDEPYAVTALTNGHDSDSSHDPDAEAPPAASTPSKTPKRRGRPPKNDKQAKSTARERTPPRALPPHEKYFFDNRPGATKTSSNTLSANALLSHEDYFEAMKDHAEPHAADIAFLHATHASNFEQWWFELSEGFSICLHGWGSKRNLIQDFGDYVVGEVEDAPKTVLVNGFAAGISVKDVLHTLASTIPTLNTSPTNPLPAQPTDALAAVLAALPSEGPPQALLLINSLDNPCLRRPASQAILAALAAHPAVALLASCNTPNFPLLWDTRLRAQFNWVFHDATSFAPFSTAEVPVVDAVNSLLGRTGRKVQGREGVVFVLRSLTESARRLYALLLAEALEAGEPQAATVGTVEYRSLYRKGVQMLIAASEIQFRQLLKEFFDHEMLTNERDSAGTEYLGVPFRREECESILEELALED